MRIGNTPRKSGKKRFGKRVRRRLNRALVEVARRTIPRLYLAYMWFVWKTSRVRDLGLRPDEVRARYGGGVFALWHEEVFFVAYSFGRFRAHTLASWSDFGTVITRMLELCGFQVFRGGSSSGRKRRAGGVLNRMIECMKTQDGVLLGITVDGSNGPVYHLKPGVILLASASGKPLHVARTCCRRFIRLPTWDGTVLPLPFNEILHLYAGPYAPCPPDAAEDVVERRRAEIENELLDLTYFAQRLLGGPDSERIPERFPPGWRPSWPDALDDPDRVLRREGEPGFPLPRSRPVNSPSTPGERSSGM